MDRFINSCFRDTAVWALLAMTTLQLIHGRKNVHSVFWKAAAFRLGLFFFFFTLVVKLFAFVFESIRRLHGLAPAAARLPPSELEVASAEARVAPHSRHPTSKLSPRRSYPDAAVAAFFFLLKHSSNFQKTALKGDLP